MQTEFEIDEFFPVEAISRSGRFCNLDEVDSIEQGALVYCQTLHYLQKANKNTCISAIICTPELAQEVVNPEVAVVVAEDPRHCFFELYMRLQQTGIFNYKDLNFGIGQCCKLHPSAMVSSESHLGDRVTVGANAVIEDGCKIGSDVVIGSNVVIGAQGLVTIRRQNGSLMFINHAGGVEIEDGCHILAGVVIAKSLFRRFTHV